MLSPGRAVWLTGGVLTPTTGRIESTAPPAAVLYEDDHLLVANKPAEQLVHDDGTDDGFTLDDAVIAYRQQTGQPALSWHVHRLDRGTTGAVLYAKHAWMARTLDTMLAGRAISRRYLAVVAGEPPQERGTLTGPMAEIGTLPDDTE